MHAWDDKRRVCGRDDTNKSRLSGHHNTLHDWGGVMQKDSLFSPRHKYASLETTEWMVAHEASGCGHQSTTESAVFSTDGSPERPSFCVTARVLFWTGFISVYLP